MKLFNRFQQVIEGTYYVEYISWVRKIMKKNRIQHHSLDDEVGQSPFSKLGVKTRRLGMLLPTSYGWDVSPRPKHRLVRLHRMFVLVDGLMVLRFFVLYVVMV